MNDGSRATTRERRATADATPNGTTRTSQLRVLDPYHGQHPHQEAHPADTGRRKLLTWLCLGGSGLIGAMLGVPIVGYLLGPLLEAGPQQWRDVAQVDDLQVGQTRVVTFEDPSALPWAGRTARTAAYLRREGERDFVAFAINCTHLGCPVNWQPEARLFLCPCHGGVYYADGSVAAGPPPHDLYRYETRIVGGRVQVQTRPLPTA